MIAERQDDAHRRGVAAEGVAERAAPPDVDLADADTHGDDRVIAAEGVAGRDALVVRVPPSRRRQRVGRIEDVAFDRQDAHTAAVQDRIVRAARSTSEIDRRVPRLDRELPARELQLLSGEERVHRVSLRDETEDRGQEKRDRIFREPHADIRIRASSWSFFVRAGWPRSTPH